MRSCMPPDPDTRTPDYVAPAGACDAHCHVFGPGDVFPYAETRKYTPPDAPKEKLFELHRKLGIERAVIVQASCHGTDNSAMLDAIAASGGRYLGICNAEPDFSDEQFAELHNGGIRGVRFNFVKHLGGAPDLAKMWNIVRHIEDLPWQVELHFDAGDLLEYEQVIDDIPLPVVIDHMGRVPVADGVEQAPFQALLEKFADSDNLWIKVSGSERISAAGPPFSDAVPFAKALIGTAPDRVIWGTDWPHPNISKFMPNDGDLVDLIPAMIPDEKTQRLVLVENPQRLFGFPPPGNEV
ncbi:MAG: amidohydrolase family protein [Woeseiaceae bacterium]|nr:amidohydrolase family protein [Woeseiaceae bacterium]